MEELGAEIQRLTLLQEGSTFDRLLFLYFQFFQRQVAVQHRDKSTTGGDTEPFGRLCPTTLRHWHTFEAEHYHVFARARMLFHPHGDPLKLFAPESTVKGIARQTCDKPLSSEKDLEIYMALSTHLPLTDMFHHLRA